MINVKDQVYQALCTCAENVSDLYPSDWANLPAVEYREEANNVYTKTEQEDLSYLRYAIYLWDNKSLSTLALAIDAALAELGLVRTACQDADDPSRLRHKVMRYEGIIDNQTQMVYWEGNH